MKCIICFSDIQNGVSIFKYFTKPDIICAKCRNRFNIACKDIKTDDFSIYALYYYNDFLEDLFFTYKEGRDIALFNIFLHPYVSKLNRKYKGYTLYFVPSSELKTKDRGFNALEMMFSELKLNKRQAFIKTSNYKQSEQDYSKRKNVEKHLKLVNYDLNDKVLLVDDMCTSGASVKCCYSLLKDAGFKEIAVFCIAINYKLDYEVNRVK